MSKPFILPQHLQQQYSVRFSEEAEKVTLSWSKELQEWYPLAIKALDFANLRMLQVPSQQYKRLFKKENAGLNMNIVTVLANNLELRSPHQMEKTAEEWIDVLALNDEIGKTWNALAEPIHKRLHTEFEIMMNKPKLVTMAEA